jgi:hypothetical protein
VAAICSVVLVGEILGFISVLRSAYHNHSGTVMAYHTEAQISRR